MLIFSIIGFSQPEPRVILIDGEVIDSTFSKIDGRNFGFKIDWGQGEKDTCRYEFIHARGSSPFSRSRGYFIGKSTQFIMQDISRVTPGDRIVFNLEIDGRKFSRSYHVLSTKAAESRPWFFDVYFMMDGDTLSTDNYQVFFRYPADSTNTPTFQKLSKNIKYYVIRPPALQHEKFSNSIRYYFVQQNELPPSFLVKHKKYQLTFEFREPIFFHGDIIMKYSPKRKIYDNSGFEYNSAIVFFNKDVGGGVSSLMFNNY